MPAAGTQMKVSFSTGRTIVMVKIPNANFAVPASSQSTLLVLPGASKAKLLVNCEIFHSGHSSTTDKPMARCCPGSIQQAF